MKNLAKCMMVVAAAGSLALVGCGKKESETAATEGDATTVVKAGFNSVCPISGDEIGESTTRVEFGGKTVALCCDDCVAMWEKLTDEERAGKIDDLMAKGKEMVEGAGEKAKEGMENMGGDGG